MDADKARPLAAYTLVSLVCAAVMIEGMRASSIGVTIGAAPDPRAAAPIAVTAAVVPGTELRARRVRQEPRLSTPAPGVLPLPPRTGPIVVGVSDLPDVSSGDSAGAARPTGRPGGRPSASPERPGGPTASAGSVATDRPGKVRKGPKKPHRTDAPEAAKNPGPDRGDKPGKGKAHG